MSSECDEKFSERGVRVEEESVLQVEAGVTTVVHLVKTSGKKELKIKLPA